MKPRKRVVQTAPAAALQASFRSGAVARLAQMPVATLRIWEQRYQAVQPATDASGQRRYSPADVQRVLQLRALTQQGHAIGSIAGLNAAQLQSLVTQSGGRPAASRGSAQLVLGVVGTALAARLQRAALAEPLRWAKQPVAVFESLSEVVAARADRPLDLLLWHAPELPTPLPAELHAARQSGRARQVAVVYRFAGAGATQALAAAGVAALREPADDTALGAWLTALADGLLAPALPALRPNPRKVAPAPAPIPPRRFDDATLTAVAGLAPQLACECPRHVAELLMQLASFERYSADCLQRNAADAEVHAYLQQVAGASRALFESALERLAHHEGLALPEAPDGARGSGVDRRAAQAASGSHRHDARHGTRRAVGRKPV